MATAAPADGRNDLDGGPPWREVASLRDDPELFTLVRRAAALGKARARELLKDRRPRPEAEREVGPEALDALLRGGGDRSDIRTDPHIADCVVFHAAGFATSLLEEEVRRLRLRIHRVVRRRCRPLFVSARRWRMDVSGHLLYPPGGFMGWHSNSRVPGWRLYLSFAEEPGRSWFRNRDPDSGEVVTSWDRGFDARLFRVDPARPLWHAVHSETWRTSMGWRVWPGDGGWLRKGVRDLFRAC